MINTCDIYTKTDSHTVLHQLEEIAKTNLSLLYNDVDFPFHAASTSQGDLYLTRILADGTQVSGKISQTSQNTLSAIIVAPALDTEDNIRELVHPLIDKIMEIHPEPEWVLSQKYQKA
jgi:hypothetical protein